MGVFNMIEQIDKPFLKHYFDENGYLFKVGAPAISLSPTSLIPTAFPTKTQKNSSMKIFVWWDERNRTRTRHWMAG